MSQRSGKVDAVKWKNLRQGLHHRTTKARGVLENRIHFLQRHLHSVCTGAWLSHGLSNTTRA